MALRMGWILEDEGEQFLRAILDSDNLDLYNIPAVQIIIEYLSTRYRAVIAKWPLYTYGL